MGVGPNFALHRSGWISWLTTMRRHRSILLLSLIPSALGAAALSGVWSGPNARMHQLPGSVVDARPGVEAGMQSAAPCVSEKACIHASEALPAGYSGPDPQGRRHGSDRPAFWPEVTLAAGEDVVPRLAHVHMPSLESHPDSSFAGRSIRMAGLGALRGGAGGARTPPAPDAPGSTGGTSPSAGDSADDLADSSHSPSGDGRGDDGGAGPGQNGVGQAPSGDAGDGDAQSTEGVPDGSGAGTRPDPGPGPGSGADAEEPSRPKQSTDTGQAGTDTDDESGHGSGHPPAPPYPVYPGPFDPEQPPVQVPEPGTLGLLIVGLLGCAARRRTTRGAGSSADRGA